ncbi:hypothetical protein HPB49_011496 [Dermacentor silvarum]|uniref:Uncharacterized protein n=1 Tax=Dermacentor silvarum TaxID=543639 RepID=A0ACB8CX40_DERSI|nr:hypothetical protein HPB49_011496 [Dermacentor silvarum]
MKTIDRFDEGEEVFSLESQLRGNAASLMQGQMMDIKAEVHRWNPEVHRSPVLGPGPGSGPVPMMTPAALSHSGPECAGCQKPIRERFLLKALDQLWHEDCLKCACCDCRLGEVGSTLFTKANLILCKRDYLRLFGTTGLCSACSKAIPAFEMVMRARGNVYHLECFACQQCNHRFCVGDRFYLHDNRILCEYDYEERALMAGVPPPFYATGPGGPVAGALANSRAWTASRGNAQQASISLHHLARSLRSRSRCSAPTGFDKKTTRASSAQDIRRPSGVLYPVPQKASPGQGDDDAADIGVDGNTESIRCSMEEETLFPQEDFAAASREFSFFPFLLARAAYVYGIQPSE